MSAGPAASYFAHYPTFTHNATARLRAEFLRLAQTQHWSQNRTKTEWHLCLRMEFERAFGTDAHPDLGAWQAMVAFCGFADSEGLDSVKKCKQFLRANAFINIVDMIDAKAAGQTPFNRRSLGALRKYSKRTGKDLPA
ncbi:hypothetical protein HMN09_01234300 [Mycena chlorophos]|uniref:Uncharacterized protein n=1 Tax=Mycena chlorophos TaxID=658473 RepID=A0A8H6S4N4_MYCCL|nr:hypothetical protein HMN09_01234300 [Mycena chlorophos]